jgi:uncharacterized RDD family membrane protein YckC
VAGLRLVREDGLALSQRDAATWWFCFNPLLFSWPTAAVTTLPFLLVVSLLLSRGTLAVFFVILTLCVASPVIALASAILDEQNRALHDRIAGTIVVPVE